MNRGNGGILHLGQTGKRSTCRTGNGFDQHLFRRKKKSSARLQRYTLHGTPVPNVWFHSPCRFTAYPVAGACSSQHLRETLRVGERHRDSACSVFFPPSHLLSCFQVDDIFVGRSEQFVRRTRFSCAHHSLRKLLLAISFEYIVRGTGSSTGSTR